MPPNHTYTSTVYGIRSIQVFFHCTWHVNLHTWPCMLLSKLNKNNKQQKNLSLIRYKEKECQRWYKTLHSVARARVHWYIHNPGHKHGQKLFSDSFSVTKCGYKSVFFFLQWKFKLIIYAPCCTSLTQVVHDMRPLQLFFIAHHTLTFRRGHVVSHWLKLSMTHVRFNFF